MGIFWVFSGMVDWHGGTFFWVFFMLIGLSGVKLAFCWAFLGVFLGIFGVSWVFLGIFWVDWYIFWVFLMLIDVSGVKSAFFWAFLGVFLGIFGVSWVFLGIFWVDWYIFWVFSMAWVLNRRRIGSVGGGSGGHCWLQLVCVWLGVCGRC